MKWWVTWLGVSHEVMGHLARGSHEVVGHLARGKS